MRYLTGRAATLKHTFLDEDGDAVTPAGATVTLVRDGASTPAAEGTATITGSECSFSAGSQPEGVYTVTWTGVTPGITDVEEVEFVGTQLFTIADIRKDPDLPVSKYPSETVRAWRDYVEQEFQLIAGRSFTRCTTRLTFDHDGSGTEILATRDTRTLNTITTPSGPGTASAYVLDGNGVLTGLTETGVHTVEVAFGLKWVPADVKKAAIKRARYLLLDANSAIPERATSFQPGDGGGIFSLATPGRNGWETGVPEVDAVLARYTYKILRDILGV